MVVRLNSFLQPAECNNNSNISNWHVKLRAKENVLRRFDLEFEKLWWTIVKSHILYLFMYVNKISQQILINIINEKGSIL